MIRLGPNLGLLLKRKKINFNNARDVNSHEFSNDDDLVNFSVQRTLVYLISDQYN